MRPEQNIKIAFFGTPEFAVPSLKALASAGFKVCSVITSQDKPMGRKKILTASPVKIAALELNLPLVAPPSLRNAEFENKFLELRPDIAVIVAYGKIIPREILSIPRLGFINIHPSLLPKYRGPSPIQSALLNGDSETGVCIMQIDELVDHGPILASKSYTIENNLDYRGLSERLSAVGAKLLVSCLEDLLVGKVTPVQQEHENATFTKMLDIADGRIDWQSKSAHIYNQFRALSHEPGVWTTWNGKRLKLHKLRLLDSANQKTTTEPGQVVLHDTQLSVCASDGPIAVETIQIEGSKAMSSSEFIKGHPDFIGAVLG